MSPSFLPTTNLLTSFPQKKSWFVRIFSALFFMIVGASFALLGIAYFCYKRRRHALLPPTFEMSSGEGGAQSAKQNSQGDYDIE